MLKVLGICGSMRENGNTEYLLKHALSLFDPAQFTTDLVLLKDLEIKPCRGCYGCVKAGRCAQEGDDFQPVFDKIVECDGLLVGSPVYYASIHPLLLSLLDRVGFSRLWSGKQLSGKVGGPITIARRTGHMTAFSQLLNWFFINDIVVPGSSYWTMSVAGGRGARDAADDEEGLRHIGKFVQNMSRVMRALHEFKE